MVYNCRMTKNQRVAVLRGGPSAEYEVSMQTGANVLSALQDLGISTVDIIINRQGDWLINGFTKSPEAALLSSDVVFLALHGSYGEDGTVQRILERVGIPYTGSRPYSSALAMNKVLTKETLANSGLKMPGHMRVSRENSELARSVETISSLFGPEYIIKPVNSGSSLGVGYAKGAPDLLKVLKYALEDHEEMLVEEYIKGREATVGVVDNFRGERIYCLPAVEIVVPGDLSVFDHESKYNGKTEEVCPGRFSYAEKQELEKAALQVHHMLDLSHYSRSDFIVNPKGVYFLEVNTLPGMTKESLMPKAIEAVGHGYGDFLLHLLDQALERKV